MGPFWQSQLIAANVTDNLTLLLLFFLPLVSCGLQNVFVNSIVANPRIGSTWAKENYVLEEVGKRERVT
jgi:hypothetical protein